MFEHRRANYYCEDHSVPHRRPTPRRHFAYRPERTPRFHPLLSAPPRRRAYGPSHRFAHISSPHLSDQDYCRSRVVNPEQTNLGKSTRSRQSEVHHVLFDTSVLVRTEEWSDAGLVGQSDQFQPLKGDEGAGKMYRSRFKMRARHVDFGANSVYDQLQHDPMRLSQAPWNAFPQVSRAQDAPLLQAQFEGTSNALTQEPVLTPCSPSPKPDWNDILRQLQSFADHHRITTASCN
ncbi:hypothetical protein IW261DRAFT_1569895 [Armillaria novae-zelandiae]|uniref:Uncharacterized protein n=1 Tax=Armillaria novae-zelandiae TaxID=153914 RepID=A0AA39NXD6_9AGAR|nr:hypothetical protein IW261DRAFT_1569895 [Armillaria novae-zelandiae]